MSNEDLSDFLDEDILSDVDEDENVGNYHDGNDLNDLTGKEWIKFTKSWKIYRPRSRGQSEKDHPAKYPEELVEDFIGFFTQEGDWVLDPFLGTGSTLVGSRSMGRNAVGIELTEKYAEVAKERASQQSLNPVKLEVINKDSRVALSELDREFDYCLTSPPYWNMLKKSRGGVESNQQKREKEGLDTKYSDSNEDLGNIEDYDAFIDELERVFLDVYDVLKDGGYLTVIIQNIRTEDGEMKPLAWDLASRLGETYVLKQEKLWLQDDKSLGIWGYPSEYVSNVAHHYCLIFKKPE
ncbi:DNA methyltransferase [Haloferax volcanii]|uniref:DNA methyltransferase n=1 Tax=Haloferax volcanii TaxID=2246 RepID=UPI0023DACD58|nr:DNA methyltransferase [Haloferax lucentense]WEL28113.1 DNA modification methylase [Haloferax lucentense]